MKITYNTISFTDAAGVITTQVGEVDSFSEAHQMIVDNVMVNRERIKAAWEKVFDFPWPCYTREITMTQRSIKGRVVIIINSSEIEWYEIN